jgi:tetratricopeptide (TPR) repeat protein
MTGVLNTDEHYQRAFELRCEGRYAEAKDILTAVLRTEPTHRDARWQMGLIKGFEGDFDGSLADLAALVAEYPSVPKIRYDLAMTQMMLGSYEEAKANFSEVLRQQPDHEQAAIQLSYFP